LYYFSIDSIIISKWHLERIVINVSRRHPRIAKVGACPANAPGLKRNIKRISGTRTGVSQAAAVVHGNLAIFSIKPPEEV
jgi:hypothetical protein